MVKEKLLCFFLKGERKKMQFVEEAQKKRKYESLSHVGETS